MEVDWGEKIKANHTSGFMLSEVDWGAHEVDWGPHDSSFFLCLEHIHHDGEPKDLFTQGQWGGLPQKYFPAISWST